MRTLPEVWVHRRPTRVSHGLLDERRAQNSGRVYSGSWLHILLVLTRNDFRARYRAQALGILWSLLNPLLMMGILSIIFTRVFHSQIVNFPVFMLLGLVIWNWVSNSIPTATQVFVSNADIVKRTVFARELLPVSVVLSYGMNFCLDTTIVFLSVVIWPAAFKLSAALLLVPVILGLLASFLTGVALATSVLNVIYRDVAYLVQTGLMILYWLTPIVYPPEVLPEPYRTIMHFNPMGAMLIAVRDAIMKGTVPSGLTWAGMILPTAVVVAAGYAIFRHYERMVLDYV